MSSSEDEDHDPIAARARRAKASKVTKVSKVTGEDENVEPIREDIAEVLRDAPFSRIINEVIDFTEDSVRDRLQRYGEDSRLTLKNIKLVRMSVGFIKDEFIAHEFIKRSADLWEDIRNRNIERFEESIMTLFHGLRKKHIRNVSAFLLQREDAEGDYITPIEPYWRALERLVVLSIQYIFAGRGPRPHPEDPERLSYKRPRYFKEVNIADVAKRWNVELRY
jgi:hypothetical protein